MARFIAAPVVGGLIMNQYGYTQNLPPGPAWTIEDSTSGDPIRVHDGFAVFTDEKQARWCAELINITFHMGQEDTKTVLRAALGISQLEEN